MAITYKVLGQSAPAAATPADLYTVPGGNSAVCSTLVICNRGVSTSYRVAIRPAGASIANQHYIVYDAAITANDSTFLTIGSTLAATDVVTVESASGNVSFNLYGSEIN
jgi:hypothetical protein